MKIESIKIKNYKAFQNAQMTEIPAMSVIVVANGSGKSTLFDVFGFLKDALVENVQKALAKRGWSVSFSSHESELPSIGAPTVATRWIRSG